MKKIVFLLLICSGCSLKEEADMILYNATIHTFSADQPKATHLAVKNGIIVAIGNEREVTGKYLSPNMVNAGGGFVYPGFIDSHCHFYGYASVLETVDLTGSRTYGEVLERVKKFAAENPNSTWITGRGWDHTKWAELKFPDNALLDSLFPHRPVLLKRSDGHAALANTAALKAAGINETTQINGGIIKVENGRMTGMLIDNAVDLVQNAIPEIPREIMVKRLKQASDNCVAAGLTMLTDAGLDIEQVMLIDSLQRTGDIAVRINVLLNPTEKNYKWVEEGMFRNTEMLRIRGFKIYADGALGSSGALLKKPYSDDTLNSGLLLTDTGAIRKALRFCLNNYLQAATHCIGDSANALILAMYGEMLKGTNDLRWRIEHAQVVDPADVNKFSAYTVIPSVQPYHAVSDMGWAEERLGQERIKGAYAYKTLLEQNGLLALGSDFPVEDINPLESFYAAVARKNVKGMPQNGWYSAEKISREDALKGLGIWGAISTFAEHFTGVLEKDKVADFVVVDKDLLRCREEEILQSRVTSTYISGKKVH